MGAAKAAKLTIRAKTITYDANGARRYTFEQGEMDELLRNNFDAEVAILDDAGDEVRVFSTKDYLAATAFLALQK